ncbi:Glypican-6, partial [Ophiophagus hannah]
MPAGEHLRICPQDYTCCASETEERLSEQGQADLRALLGETGAFVIRTLSSRQQRFQDFFQELLAGAERSLQAMFAHSYGCLYVQHARLFQGLFVELHHHLKGPRPSLDEDLSDFWSQLLERMLPLLNPQYSFPEGYLECVGHQVESLSAFGDSPRQLQMQVSPAAQARTALWASEAPYLLWLEAEPLVGWEGEQAVSRSQWPGKKGLSQRERERRKGKELGHPFPSLPPLASSHDVPVCKLSCVEPSFQPASEITLGEPLGNKNSAILWSK